MAKADSKKVNQAFGDALIATGKDLNGLYTEAVLLSYRTTGRLAPTFDAKDLVAWVKENHPEKFDAKGRRIKL
jgi:hypothetical protein